MLTVGLIILFSNFLSNAAQQGRVWVDDFESGTIENWDGRRKGFEKIYRVKADPANKFLSARSINSDNFIVKRIYVDLNEYPYLNWRWRAKSIPEKGNEGVRQYCDAPASIAVVLNRSRIFPKSIKYSWSSTLPAGSVSKSPFAKWPAKCDIVVAESGSDKLGEWVYEKHNVKADYESFSKKSNQRRKDVFAVVIMTDSDNLGELSEADYDDIYFSRS